MFGAGLATGLIVGLVIGFMIGFLIAAFMDTASREDDAMEQRHG